MFNSKAVSAAKGVGILLMVVGHSACPVGVHDYIYVFHMPLFFILSGYCFKMKYLDDAVSFIRRRIAGLWWPYVKWGIVFLILHNVFFRINFYDDIYSRGGGVSHLYTWYEFLINGLNIVRFCHEEGLIGPFWFLKELFWASLIGYLCIRYLKKFSYSGGGMLILLMVFLYIGPTFCVPVLRLTARTWMATFFFLYGHAWRKNEESGGFMSCFDNHSNVLQIILVFLLAVAVKVIAEINGFSEMLSLSFKKAPLFVCGGICGTMMVVYICRWISSWEGNIASNCFSFIGRHTLEVLTWHFLCFKIVSLIIIAVYGIPEERLMAYLVIKRADLQALGVDISYSFWWIAYFSVGAGIPLLWQYLWTKKGKKE